VDANQVRAVWERAARRAADDGAAAAPPGLPATVPTFAGVPAVTCADELEGVGAVVLGIPFGGAGDAPRAIRRHSLTPPLPPGDHVNDIEAWPARLARLGVVDYGDVEIVTGDVATTFTRAHERLADIVAAGAVPVVFGGDHGVTVAVLQVLAGMLSGKLGVVTLDAGLDLCFEPRYLAGSQWARAFELGVVETANFAAIGVREAAVTALDQAVADELGLRVYTMADIDTLGIVTVAQEALEVAAAGTEAIYVSLDVDVLDPSRDTAACLRPPAGLGGRELALALRTLAAGRVAGFDVCGSASGQAIADGCGRDAACAVVEVLAGLAAQCP
jgi:arginase family enzyme